MYPRIESGINLNVHTWKYAWKNYEDCEQQNGIKIHNIDR